MLPETMISGAYTAMSAAHAMYAVNPGEIFIAAMYLAVALIYLIAPHLRKELPEPQPSPETSLRGPNPTFVSPAAK